MSRKRALSPSSDSSSPPLSPRARSSVSSSSPPHLDADHPPHSSKRRRVGHVPQVQSGFEGMALDENGLGGGGGTQHQGFGNGFPTSSIPGQPQLPINGSFPTWLPQQPDLSVQDIQPDSDGDIPLESADDIMYPQTVTSPDAAHARLPDSASSEEFFVPDNMASGSGWNNDGTRKEGDGMDFEELGGTQGKGWKPPKSYEIEKDRVFVSSLSDTDDSPASSPSIHTSSVPLLDISASDDDIIDLDTISQPGAKGFTISPSLLARLRRRDPDFGAGLRGFDVPGAGGRGKDQLGLVIYRTPGLPPSSYPKSEAGGDERVDLGAHVEEIEDENEANGMREDGMDMDLDMGGVDGDVGMGDGGGVNGWASGGGRWAPPDDDGMDMS